MKWFFALIFTFATALFLVWIIFGKQEPAPLPQNNDDGSYVFPADDHENTGQAFLPRGYTYKEIQPSFSTIASAQPTSNFQLILENIYLDYYSITPCVYENLPENVIRLTFDDSEESGNNMEYYRVLVEAWEPDILQDIGHLLFNDIKDHEKQRKLVFVNTQDFNIRTSELLVNGTSRAIYYAFDDNTLYLASSLECIERVDEAIMGPNHFH